MKLDAFEKITIIWNELNSTTLTKRNNIRKKIHTITQISKITIIKNKQLSTLKTRENR